MTSDLHHRAKELFLEACRLPEDERGALLDDVCGGDTDLREEVESLLRFHDERGTGTGGDGQLPMNTINGDPPETIGHYRLVQKLGEGGMGEVYEAEQTEPVRRLVALKVIKWGMDTKEVVARFESERQALALMDHPNIAKVFEAGSTDQGRPYFAMEFVRGVPITDYCDTHRLSTEERLRLFVTVCDAVQHAHQKGIIHRDLKPSNIMVTIQDDRAAPKIIDFGVAKATSQRLTERTVFTALGQWIGTPEYMSPEQAELTGLDVDTRTDVYSLGVVLYELLVGAQPFDSTALRAAGFDEMRRRIREDEPPRPSTRVSSLGDTSQVAARSRRTDLSTLMRQLRGDLDWITMKALEKDRTRRYGSPSDLAADIERHLDNEPVVASPPSTPYRLGKFVRRHRVGVVAGLLILIAVLAGFIGTAVGLLKAQREAEAARQVVHFISGIFWGMNPGEPSSQVSSIREVLAQGAKRVHSELGGQPLVAAEMQTIIGQVYMGLGEFDAARPLLEGALALRELHLGEDHPAVASSLNRLAVQRITEGRFREASPLSERALSIYEHNYGPDSGSAGIGHDTLCMVQWRLGAYFAALDHCNRSLEILESVYGTDHLVYADTLYHLMIVLRELGEIEGSIEAGERSLEIREDRLGSEHSAVGWTIFDLGIVYRIDGDRERATASFERALEIQQHALGKDHFAISYPLAEIARGLMIDGDLEAARPIFERAIEVRERANGSDHPDLQWVLRPYADLHRRSGDTDRALEIYRRALELTEDAYGPDHIEVGRILGSIGYTIYRGDLDAAKELYSRDLTIRQQTFGPTHRMTAISYYNLTCLAALAGDRDEALRLLRLALDCDGWAWAGLPDDEDLDSLRGDPEFEEMLDEVRRRLENE